MRVASLKAIPLFLPVAVVVECNTMLLFSILAGDLDAMIVADSLEPFPSDQAVLWLLRDLGPGGL